jgi:hypothetical protein
MDYITLLATDFQTFYFTVTTVLSLAFTIVLA